MNIRLAICIAIIGGLLVLGLSFRQGKKSTNSISKMVETRQMRYEEPFQEKLPSN